MFDKKKITIKIMTFLFVIVHTILYILLYGFGLFQSVENKIIYFMILNCLVFSFLLLIIEKRKVLSTFLSHLFLQAFLILFSCYMILAMNYPFFLLLLCKYFIVFTSMKLLIKRKSGSTNSSLGL